MRTGTGSKMQHAPGVSGADRAGCALKCNTAQFAVKSKTRDTKPPVRRLTR